MPPGRNNLIGAMFDVRPVDETGRVDFEKLSGLTSVIKLRKLAVNSRAELRDNSHDLNRSIEIKTIVSKNNRESVLDRKTIARELELAMARIDLPEIKNERGFYGETSFKNKLRPRLVPIKSNDSSFTEKDGENYGSAVYLNDDVEKRILSEIRKPAKTSEIESFYLEPTSVKTKGSGDLIKPDPQFKKEILPIVPADAKKEWWRLNLRVLILIGTVLAGSLLVSYAINLKNDIVSDGNSAVKNLEVAKDKIEKLDFIGASDSFLAAYQEFTQASDGLNFLGSSLGGLISDLPGASKMKSANNLLEAGKLIADSGKAMSEAMDVISKTSLILNPGLNNGEPISKMLSSLRNGLTISNNNLNKASLLLSDIDPEILPEGKRETFIELKSKLPLFLGLVGDSADYAEFLEELVGVKGAKKYLLLFQNQAELRATGGFPGSYGVVSFEDGSLKEFFVDDVYNLDGQLKENIIPPKEMQHIAPTWGMRDANWFVDFPISAKKIITFYKKETSGATVDGVITVSPLIVSKILEIVGPIDMPEYNIEISSDNFATAIQSEVEYGPNRTQPKKILMDLAPRLLAKIYSADKDKWLTIFNVLISSLEQDNILMYFKSLDLQSFALEKGFSGQIDSKDRDYLMINLTNVKGSKTDTVTDTSINLDAVIKNQEIIHKVSITRKHNGGNSKFGFYNKQNPAYVRILVPAGSELISITNNQVPNFKPLVSYADSSFKKDEDLMALESSRTFDKQKGVWIGKEAGKTVFAFWLIVDPKNEKTIELEYKVPNKYLATDYEMLIQKQPGLKVANFNFNLEKDEQLNIAESAPILNKIGDKYMLNDELNNDLLIKIKFE